MGKFQHYLIVALRSLKKNKVSSALSLLGLSAAFALSLISGMMIWDAYSSDSHWKNADNIYSVKRMGLTGREFKMGIAWPEGGSETLKGLSPDILALTSIKYDFVNILREARLLNFRVWEVDEKFTKVFDLSVISGNLEAALSDPYKLVISDRFSIKQFGDTASLGKTITLVKDKVETLYTIGAIIEAPPKNSRFIYINILRRANDPENDPASRQMGGNNQYALFKDGANVTAITKQFETVFHEKYPKPDYVKSVEYSIEKLKGAGFSYLSNDHYKQRVIGLFGSSAFLLLIGILNHMSLSVAIAASRAREVALRKVLGASRLDLTMQALLESLLIVTLAYGLALVLAESMVAPLDELIGAEFILISGGRMPELLSGWGIALLIGFLTALYPIWVSLRDSISATLAGNQRGVAGGGNKIRSLLLALQALCGLGLALVAGVIFVQTQSLEKMDKGFDVDGLMYVSVYYHFTKDNPTAVGTLLNEFTNIKGVKNISAARIPPFSRRYSIMQAIHPVTGEEVSMDVVGHSDNYVETLGLKLIAGRAPKALPKPEKDAPPIMRQSVMANEAFLQKYSIGTAKEAIGTCIYTVYTPKDAKEEVKTCLEIVGVLADHHEAAGENPVKAMVYMPSSYVGNIIILRVDTTNLKQLLDDMNVIWRKVLPFAEFKYKFLDEKVAEAYGQYRAMSYLLLFTAIGSLFLTVAGLYAMAKFVVARRGREIAIRRVLGASSSDIVKLVVVQLAKPIIIGALIGLPLGWYYAMDWLSAYSVRIEPVPWHAVLLGIFGVAFFLISATGEILRAVRIRPAEALHYE